MEAQNFLFIHFLCTKFLKKSIAPIRNYYHLISLWYRIPTFFCMYALLLLAVVLNARRLVYKSIARDIVKNSSLLHLLPHDSRSEFRELLFDH